MNELKLLNVTNMQKKSTKWEGGILFHGTVQIDLIYCTTIYSIRFGVKKCQSMFLFHLFGHLYILLGLA